MQIENNGLAVKNSTSSFIWGLLRGLLRQPYNYLVNLKDPFDLLEASGCGSGFSGGVKFIPDKTPVHFVFVSFWPPRPVRFRFRFRLRFRTADM